MPSKTPPPPQAAGSSQMLMMMMIFATMFIMFIPELRDAVGNIAGIVLEPVIGFNGKYPVLTVLFAGIGLVTFSSAVRHYFIDWVDTAEKQHKMKDFNKTLRDAQMARNDAEVKRLREKQLEMSKDQMTSTFDQMKPMMFTMIFLIGTFAFIGTFIGDIPGATLSVPWSSNVDMKASLSTSTCCAFSNWMLLYMLVSMSVAQVIQRVFKYYSFSKALNDPDSKIWKAKAEPAEADEEPEDDLDLEPDEGDEYLEIEEETESAGGAER
ncbi:MAG: EMC3/TMCO1 family protein [Thermoplasmata archaeon]